MSVLSSSHRAALTALMAMATVVAGLAGASLPAGAVAAPAATVQAGLSLSSSTVRVGTAVQVVARATNTTSSTLSLVSMGVDVPTGLKPTAVSGTLGCHPRNITRLVYCGVQNLAPHATATLTFTVTPATAGSFPFRSYARETYKNNDTFAYATLTVTT